MKTIASWCVVLCLAAGSAAAQSTNDLEKFEQQLKQLQDNFEKQQRDSRENFERMMREQQRQIEALKAQIEAGKTNAPPPAALPPLSAPDTAPAPPLLSTPSQPWSPAQPLRFGTAQNYLGLSFDGLFSAGGSTASNIPAVEPGAHDPKQNGFTVQNLELTLDGKVDPYFRGQASIVWQIDTAGETSVEAEEAYLESLSLPWNLQVRAGQFLTEFGRINPTHPHTWDFVDVPLVCARLLGPEGMRGAGARVSWLAPTSFYSELLFAIQNSTGETGFSYLFNHDDQLFMGRPANYNNISSFDDMLFVPRYVASFNLSDAQTVVAGVSAAFGPNSSGNDVFTQVYGADLFWKWKPPNQYAGFPFVTWQTEGMMRVFHAAYFPGDATTPQVPAETITDYGVYSEIAYGFTKGWVAALRADYVFPGHRAEYENIEGSDPSRVSWLRISPNITFYLSEFSKFRLQFNYDNRDTIGEDYSVWFQFEFLLGSHSAHKF